MTNQKLQTYREELHDLARRIWTLGKQAWAPQVRDALSTFSLLDPTTEAFVVADASARLILSTEIWPTTRADFEPVVQKDGKHALFAERVPPQHFRLICVTHGACVWVDLPRSELDLESYTS